MRYLFSQDSRTILRRLAQEKTLCAFDFDGTLAPIVDDPDAARMRDRTRILLEQLAEAYPCVVLSGRARADLRTRLSGMGMRRIIGNHGAEVAPVPGYARLVQKWRKLLQQEVGELPGVRIEYKGLSLAVHYRQALRKAEARRKILAATARLEKARIFGGKQVVNVVSDDANHKGGALAGECSRLGCSWMLYVGDDENDEQAFAMDGNLIAVRVGRKKTSQARYYLRRQTEIDRLLAELVSLRS